MIERQLIVAHYQEDLTWLNDLSIPTIIYSKGPDNTPGTIKLPNIGREAHTYLYHITTNYDNLAHLNYFIQADPFFHAPDILARLIMPYRETTPLTGCYHGDHDKAPVWAQRLQAYYGYNTTLFKCDKWGRPYNNINVLHRRKPLAWVWSNLFTMPIPKGTEILWIPAAMMVVPQKRITDRPLAFYQKALELVDHPSLIFKDWKAGKTKAGKIRKAGWHEGNRGAWIFEKLWYYIFNDVEFWPSNLNPITD